MNSQQNRKEQSALQFSLTCVCGDGFADGEGAAREVFHHPWALQQKGRLLMIIFGSSELMHSFCDKHQIQGEGQARKTKPKMSVYVRERDKGKEDKEE